MAFIVREKILIDSYSPEESDEAVERMLEEFIGNDYMIDFSIARVEMQFL